MSTDQSAEQLLHRADQLESLGRADEAIALYEQAHALDPYNAQAVMRLAAALTYVDRKRANELSRRALTMAPESLRALLIAAWAANSAGKQDDAIDFAEQAVALAPASADAHRTLATVLCWRSSSKRKRKRYVDRARAASEESIRLNPHSSWAWHAAAHVALYDENKDEARGHFMQALKIDPNNTLVERQLAELNNTEARPASALAILQYMVRNDPTNNHTKRVFDEVLDDVVSDVMWAAFAFGVVTSILIIIVHAFVLGGA